MRPLVSCGTNDSAVSKKTRSPLSDNQRGVYCSEYLLPPTSTGSSDRSVEAYSLGGLGGAPSGLQDAHANLLLSASYTYTSGHLPSPKPPPQPVLSYPVSGADASNT